VDLAGNSCTATASPAQPSGNTKLRLATTFITTYEGSTTWMNTGNSLFADVQRLHYLLLTAELTVY
jgi:hypothetical protein